MSDGIQYSNGQVVKIESYADESERKKWKIVRMDSYVALEGVIVSARVDTGDCCLLVTVDGKSQAKTYALGCGGIRIIRR